MKSSSNFSFLSPDVGVLAKMFSRSLLALARVPEYGYLKLVQAVLSVDRVETIRVSGFQLRERTHFRCGKTPSSNCTPSDMAVDERIWRSKPPTDPEI